MKITIYTRISGENRVSHRDKNDQKKLEEKLRRVKRENL